MDFQKYGISDRAVWDYIAGLHRGTCCTPALKAKARTKFEFFLFSPWRCVSLFCTVLFCKSLVYQLTFFSLWTNAELRVWNHVFFSGYGSCFIPSLFDYGLKVLALLKACACKKELCSSLEISISNPLQKIPHIYRYAYKYHVSWMPLILPQFCMLILHVWIPEEEILLCTVNNTQLCKVSDVLNKMYVFTDWSVHLEF